MLDTIRISFGDQKWPSSIAVVDQQDELLALVHLYDPAELLIRTFYADGTLVEHFLTLADSEIRRFDDCEAVPLDAPLWTCPAPLPQKLLPRGGRLS